MIIPLGGREEREDKDLPPGCAKIEDEKFLFLGN
jgi:hypothetical protein